MGGVLCSVIQFSLGRKLSKGLYARNKEKDQSSQAVAGDNLAEGDEPRVYGESAGKSGIEAAGLIPPDKSPDY